MQLSQTNSAPMAMAVLIIADLAISFRNSPIDHEVINLVNRVLRYVTNIYINKWQVNIKLLHRIIIHNQVHVE